MALDNRAEMVLSDWKRLVRELNKIEPKYLAEIKQQFRELAEPVRHGVRNAIPNQPPLSGMRRKLSPTGKTWNTRRRARTVNVRLRNPKRKMDRGAALVQLVIPAPATVMADMAGRGNSRLQGKTDWYAYPLAKNITENSRPGERRHTVTRQGDIFVSRLSGRFKGPSRFAYPGAEEAMPAAQQKFAEIIGRATDLIERQING